MVAVIPAATAAAVARLAAFGLPGVDPTPIVLSDPSEVLDVAAAKRVLPWVAAAVDAGWVADLSDEWRTDLRARRLAAIQTTLAAHSAAIDVAGRLTAAGIGDARILKGCATAHLDYERPADRFSTDVDVLIRPTDRPALIAQFPDDVIPAPRSAHWQGHYGKSTTVTTGRQVQLDVHTMLGQGYFGLAIPIDELFADPASFTIGGTDLLALDGPNRLIHAANHAPLAHGLHSVRDVLQLVLVTGVDWESAVGRVQRWGVDVLFARGVLLAWSTFPVPSHPLADWARTRAARGRQRLALRLVGDRPRGHLLTAPLALPLREWPGYVGPMVFPSREYLAENGKSWATRTRSMFGELLPSRSR
jgi:hypothetical protein